MKAKSRRALGPSVISPVGQILSTEDVAKLLDVSQRTVQELIRTGKLQAVRVGKRYRILGQHIRQFFGQEAPRSPSDGV
jgi:excisionase family DNA binding protein